MKQTNMPWRFVRLGDVAKTASGGTPKRTVSAYYGGGIPWVKSGELGDSTVFETSETISKTGLDNSSAKIFPKGTLCVALYGATVGKLGILGTDAATNQAVCGVFLPSEIDTRFAYRFLESRRRQLVESAKGGAQPNISQEIIRDLQFPLPSLSDQQRIVGEIEKQFSRLEEGVGALKRVQANLKRYRAAVLKAACEGQLVPTEAERQRAKGRGTRGGGKFETGEELLARILAERRKNWQGRGKYKEPAAPDTSKHGKLPDGWAWATFEQIAERVTVGFVGSMKHEYVENGVPFLRGQNVRENRFDPDGLLHISHEFHRKLSKSALRPGDLAIVRSGSVGVTCVIPDSLPDSNCSDLVLVQRPLGFVPQYGAYYMNSLAKRHVAAGKVGVALIHFNTKSVASLAVPLPPIAEQKRIVAEVERRLSVVEEMEATVEANLQRATRLRQSILQKAFEGKLVANGEAAPAAVGQSAKTVKSPRLQRHFARAILSAEIVHRLYQEPTFGRTKHQKIFHLCEYIAQIGEIQGQYHRDAAGPLDNKLIYANEDELKRQKWFETISRDGGKGHAYKPLEKAGEHRQYVERFWPDKLPGVGILIELMRAWKTEQCEIFCTTYAAWNDLILWGKEPTDDAILHEILECWHESKRRIPEERWKKAIEWMKKSGFAPSGFGQPTKKID